MKHWCDPTDAELPRVAPRTGAWIETVENTIRIGSSGVAPRTGAWIETWLKKTSRSSKPRRPPHGGVD